MADKTTKTEVKTGSKAERIVEIKIPKERGDDSDVIVGINGKLWQIQRGKTVKVPWSVYRQLQHHYRMEEEADDYKQKMLK